MNRRDQKKKKPDAAERSSRPEAKALPDIAFWHLRVGWWSLLLFLTLGILLEAMHGFKVQAYLGEQNATRRLMWTLAHVHGTLLSLVHLGFASAANILGEPFVTNASWRSRA